MLSANLATWPNKPVGRGRGEKNKGKGGTERRGGRDRRGEKMPVKV